MSQIKAIIFDADGPLYQRTSNNTDANIKLLHEYGFRGEYSEFVEAYNQDIHKVYDRSETVDTLFRRIFSRFKMNVDNTAIEAFIDHFYKIRSQISPSPHAVETLKWFHENDYKTCVLTDHYLPAEGLHVWFEMLGESGYIDEIVSSFDTRRLKGSPEAFQECLTRLGLTNKDVVFVGHQQYELDGAGKAGVASVCLSSIAIPADAKGKYAIESLTDLPNLVTVMNGS